MRSEPIHHPVNRPLVRDRAVQTFEPGCVVEARRRHAEIIVERRCTAAGSTTLRTVWPRKCHSGK